MRNLLILGMLLSCLAASCGSGDSCGGSNFTGTKVTGTFSNTSSAPGASLRSDDKVDVNCGGCGTTSGSVTLKCASSADSVTVSCVSGAASPTTILGQVPSGNTGCKEGIISCPSGAINQQCTVGTEQ